VNASGNVYVTGNFRGSVDFDPGPGVENHSSIAFVDIFLSRFDSSGNFQRADVWGGSDWDTGYKVAVDTTGNVYVTGYFMETVDFDPGPGIDNRTANGWGDVFLSKFAP